MERDVHRPDGPPVAAAAVLHPHPAMGGDRHHPVVVAVSAGLAERGVAAMRPDLTDPDPARAVARFTEAAAAWRAEVGVEHLVLVGYSWGSLVASGAAPAGCGGRVLIAPPVALAELGGDDGVPTLVLVPAHDQYGGPDAVDAALGGRAGVTIEVVPGADHFLTGAIAPVADRVVAWSTALLTGAVRRRPAP